METEAGLAKLWVSTFSEMRTEVMRVSEAFWTAWRLQTFVRNPLSSPPTSADRPYSGYSYSINDLQGRIWSGICTKGEWVVAYCSPRCCQVRSDAGKHHQINQGDY